MRKAVLSMAIVLGWAWHCQAQTAPAKYDIGPLVKGLKTVETREAALAQLKEVPKDALVPLWGVVENPETPERVRQDIRSGFREIYKRLEAERVKHELELEKAWNQGTIDAYNAVGMRNPKWDALAVAALSKLDRSVDCFNRFKAVVAAGCNDPLIAYYYALRGMDTAPAQLEHDEGIRLLQKAAQDLDASKYPDSRKLYGHLRFLQFAKRGTYPVDMPLQLKAQSYDRALQLLGSLAGGQISERHWRESEDILEAAGKSIGESPKSAYEKLYAAFVKAFPQSDLGPFIQVDFYTDYAWEARGGGWAADVKEDGWKLFGERLKIAGEAGRRGWELDPLNYRCAEDMIRVCMGEGRDRAEMETWFQRAMLANPYAYDACRFKMTYLLPKWNGSLDEVLAFGEECVKNSTPDSRQALVMVEAIASLRKDAADEAALMAQPRIWKDIQAAYEKLLSDPSMMQTKKAQCLADRAEYLKYAVACQQWQAALDLMDRFGADVDMKQVGGQGMYDFYKKKAKDELAKK